MNINEEQKNWLEKEISEQKHKVSEPSKQDKIGRNRSKIESKIKEIGFVYNRHIPQDFSWGVGFSYEQYQLYINEYNMKIICAIGSESIHVATRDLETNDCYYLFEYGTYGTYRFANNPSKFIEEFKFLLKHSFFQCLRKIGKENSLVNYQLYDLAYPMKEREPNTILSVFCDK